MKGGKGRGRRKDERRGEREDGKGEGNERTKEGWGGRVRKVVREGGKKVREGKGKK